MWWLGFDTVHGGDFAPGMAFSLGRGVYRTLDYVRSECESLAAQLADAAERSRSRYAPVRTEGRGGVVVTTMHREATASLIRSAFRLAAASPDELPLASATFRLAQAQARYARAPHGDDDAERRELCDANLATLLTCSVRLAEGEPVNDVEGGEDRYTCPGCGASTLDGGPDGCRCLDDEPYRETRADVEWDRGFHGDDR